MADRAQTDRDWKTEATAWRARAEHLQATVDRLRSLAVAGEAAGFLAHELNNLFTPVVGYCHAAQDERADEAIKAKALKKATAAAERVGEVSRAILGLAGSANAAGSVSAREVVSEADVGQCVEAGLLALGVERWGREGIEIKIDVPRGTLVKAPGGVVQQVVMNLVLNARRAMVGQRGRLEIVAMEVGGTVRMEVRDQGVGMSEGVIGRVFGITKNDNKEASHQFEVDVQDLARSGSINGQARWGVRLREMAGGQMTKGAKGETENKNIARLRGARLDASASPIKVWDAAEVAREMREGEGKGSADQGSSRSGSGGVASGGVNDVTATSAGTDKDEILSSKFKVQGQDGDACLSGFAGSTVPSLHGGQASDGVADRGGGGFTYVPSCDAGGARGGGTGLGLALCLELVSRVSGRISARSEVGVGTVVCVEWPGAVRAKRAA